MRVLAHALLVAVLSLITSSAAADAANGTYDLQWDSCTGPIEHCPTADGQNELYATVVGINQPHKAYQVQLFYGNETTDTVPDAWRFDAPGCQGITFVQIDHVPPPALVKTCPAFRGPASSLEIKEVSFAFPPPGFSGNWLRINLLVAYGDAITMSDPAKRYFLERVIFDHSQSVAGATTPGVSCGGFEAPIRVRTAIASYLTPGGQEVEFGHGGTRTVTSMGVGACSPVPAVGTTWGAVKGQYRR